jgi:hypothetical protein
MKFLELEDLEWRTWPTEMPEETCFWKITRYRDTQLGFSTQRGTYDFWDDRNKVMYADLPELEARAVFYALQEKQHEEDRRNSITTHHGGVWDGYRWVGASAGWRHVKD